MKVFDRRALFASGAAAALLAATGVSAAPERGGRLRAALSGGKRDATWLRPADGLFMQVAAAGTVLDGLTEIAADGTLRGALAESWESHDGAQSWIFRLRKGVMFHDGVPLQASDVAASLSRHAQFAVTVVEDSAIEIILTDADPNLPYLLGGPQYVVQPADLVRRSAGVGTGLYKVRKWDPGQHLIADRVATHFKDGQAGWFDIVEFVSFSAPEVRAQALIEGLVDVADVEILPTNVSRHAFTALPTEEAALQFVRASLGVPTTVGKVFPLDNLRMAERWWMG